MFARSEHEVSEKNKITVTYYTANQLFPDRIQVFPFIAVGTHKDNYILPGTIFSCNFLTSLKRYPRLENFTRLHVW